MLWCPSTSLLVTLTLGPLHFSSPVLGSKAMLPGSSRLDAHSVTSAPLVKMVSAMTDSSSTLGNVLDTNRHIQSSPRSHESTSLAFKRHFSDPSAQLNPTRSPFFTSAINNSSDEYVEYFPGPSLESSGMSHTFFPEVSYTACGGPVSPKRATYSSLAPPTVSPTSPRFTHSPHAGSLGGSAESASESVLSALLESEDWELLAHADVASRHMIARVETKALNRPMMCLSQN